MFSNNKIKQQLSTYHTYLYANFTPITGLEFWHDTREDRKSVPEAADWSPIETGAKWSGRDAYYWLRFKITVPPLKPADHYVLHLDLGRSGGGGNSGFEGFLYVDGHPRQAIDSNHEEAYFDASTAGQTLEIAIMLWTGLEGGGPQQIQHYVLNELTAGVLIQPIREAYRWLDLMYQTVLELDANEPLLYEYQKLLDRELRRFIWGAMDLAAITEQSEAVLADVQAFLAKHKGEKKQFRISAVGHTHIDVAWLWRLRHTREKTGRSFSTVLELMKEYPEYIFMHSTPQVYDFVKHDYPELYAQIKQRVAEGRFEPEGATWLEPDTNVPSGEALTRQFLYGTRFFAREFNAKQNVLWLPDVFGYSWALPQIMKGFGIDDFMTTKISWNDTNRMPHDTFVWQGLDGTEVLTHFITTVDQGDQFHNSHNWQYTYNGNVTPHTVLGSYYVYADKALNNDLLLSYGWGDGGGGPQREMIENIGMLNQLPGLPTVEPTRVDDYFKRLHHNLDNAGLPLPKWDGELYLEFHRGTYTSQARVKQQNRQLEWAMRDLELRYVEAGIARGVAYPHAEIDELWETILRNQFHDILPGSAIHEVYEDNAKEYADCFATIKALNAKLDETELQPAEQAYTLRNLNAFPVTSLVTLPAEAGQVVDAAGQALPSQASDDGVLVEATVPALSATTVTVRPGGAAAAAPLATTTATSIDTPHYQLSWNEAGQLTSVLDHDHDDREVLAGLGNELTVYEDRPTTFDNWNIDEDYPEKAITLTADNITVATPEPLRQRVTFHFTFQHSEITQVLTVFRDSRRIDFATHIDWHDHQFLLRTAFDTAILAAEASYDVQYGNVRRPTHRNTSWDTAKFETVGHKWADLAQREYGVALLNDAKYGYNVHGGVLSLSLLKSGIDPDTEADQGEHNFTYSLLPHTGDFVAGDVEREATILNHGLTVQAGEAATTAAAPFTFTAAHPVAVDAIKHSEDGNAVILRFHEYAGENDTITVTPTFAHGAVALAKLDETPTAPLTATEDTYAVKMTPYHVATLRIELK
ncbi:alpha-mannosidase [Lacticaseibacillus nasuensis]|uniref:alpha-mannosidase n=1 Tax=Lacticaseibacillus nasuensis TaxID=944671 RepID=UPI0022462382|nr:glycoside hydrolase family 38 C-terminal domain-containing protein [Lacticaseibacillus nasuensis]MCX2455143.1 glycosyl hydrolase-related protein [Lacticaseibacillus nasuensis]